MVPGVAWEQKECRALGCTPFSLLLRTKIQCRNHLTLERSTMARQWDIMRQQIACSFQPTQPHRQHTRRRRPVTRRLLQSFPDECGFFTHAFRGWGRPWHRTCSMPPCESSRRSESPLPGREGGGFWEVNAAAEVNATSCCSQERDSVGRSPCTGRQGVGESRLTGRRVCERSSREDT